MKGKELDYYQLLGLEHERWMATEAQLKQCRDMFCHWWGLALCGQNQGCAVVCHLKDCVNSSSSSSSTMRLQFVRAVVCCCCVCKRSGEELNMICLAEDVAIYIVRLQHVMGSIPAWVAVSGLT